MTEPDYEGLRPYASTPRQHEYLDAIAEHGSCRAASRALGIDKDLVSKSMRSLRLAAERRGHSPEHNLIYPVPESYKLERYTTQIGPDGKVRNHWIKGALDAEKHRLMMEDVWQAFATDLPKAPEVDTPEDIRPELLNLYTFTDYHMGMLAWHEEGGDDWDLGIASDLLRRSFIHMMHACPKAQKAVINIQGDFLHTDGLTPVTPGHGHVLDADSRFRKIARTAVEIIREMVLVALERHEEVELLICEGNHDESSSAWMQICFAMYFAENPRVTVHQQALPFYAIEWGKTMLAFHHGHKVKNEQLPLLFASTFAEVWGRTKRRYCNTGHRHHYDSKEHSGMYVTQHPTLSARDAYASRGGWMSERAAIGITFHKKYGKVDERWVCPESVADD